jgi:ribulose-5-phosphate 4-epimerase/fuculose-1-phosphate aldolase
LDHEELRQEVARVSRRMSESSGLDYALMEPEDVVLVSLHGNVLDGPYKPSVETPMHTGIYRSRPEVSGIVHTHARYSTTLACLGWEIPPIHYMLAVLSDEGRVPLAGYATYGTDELARNASEALGGSHGACLLSNHGTIAVGASVSEAYSRTQLLEEMAEVYYRAKLAGEPVLLTPDQLAEVSAKIHDYGQSKPSPTV